MSFEGLVGCPVCNARVSLKLVWDITPKNRFGLLAHSTGVVCSTCSTKLRIRQSRSALAVAALYLLAFLAIASARTLVPLEDSSGTVFAVAIVLAALALHGRIARHFAGLQRREGLDTVDFPVERLKEQLKEVQAVADDGQEQPVQIEGPAWNCASCHEENPGGFELCWKCGASSSNDI